VTETEFNADFRAVLRTQGLGNLHIREADQPGVSDLVIWQDRIILAWVELKVELNTPESHQDQWAKAREAESGNAYYIRLLDTKKGLVSVYILNPDFPNSWMCLSWGINYRLTKWAVYFEEHRRIV
jgi:hypothetical protein